MPVLIDSVVIVRILANGILKLLNALSHANDLLFKRGLLRLEVAQLLVQSDALGAHRTVVPVDLLLDAMQLVGQGLPRVLALHGEYIFEGLLLAAQNLHLLLMRGEVLVELAACLC